MTEPTKEQVLEWCTQLGAKEDAYTDMVFGLHIGSMRTEWIIQLCALACAAGKAGGAREENEEAARVCDLEHAACWNADAISQAKEAKRCADAIRARRPA